MDDEELDTDTAQERRRSAVLVGAVAAFALLSLALTGTGRRRDTDR